MTDTKSNTETTDKGDTAPAPWEKDGAIFDADKAKALIENLRGDVAEAKTRLRSVEGERDAALASVSTRDAELTELKATMQLAVDEADSTKKEFSELATLRTKELLLIDAGLDRSLATNISGETEEDWAADVQKFAALKGSTPQRKPDPAQQGAEPKGSEGFAEAFFGL